MLFRVKKKNTLGVSSKSVKFLFAKEIMSKLRESEERLLDSQSVMINLCKMIVKKIQYLDLK